MAAVAVGVLTLCCAGRGLALSERPSSAQLENEAGLVARKTRFDEFLDRLAQDGPSLLTVLGVGGACYGKLRELEGKQDGFERSIQTRLETSEKAFDSRLQSSEKLLGSRLEAVESSLAGLTSRFDQLLVSLSQQQGFAQGREVERQAKKQPPEPASTGGGRRRRPAARTRRQA